MVGEAAVARRTIARVLAFTAAAALAAPIGYTYMFFGFRPYDDEGYMLVTLKDYLAGRPLVTPFTQLYGPFYYEVMGPLYRLLGLVPGHDNGRFVTLGVWLVAGVLGGVAAYRLTRNLWLGVAAQVVTLSVLTSLSSEPMTTYGLSAVLLIGLVVAATYRSSQPRAAATVMGAIVAALCLIKINVGVFAAIPVVLAWVASLPPRWRGIVGMPAVAMAVIAPFALMTSRLQAVWLLEFAAVISLSSAAIAVAHSSTPQREMPPRSTPFLVGGLLVTGALIVAIALAGGSHLDDLWNGLVVTAIRFPGTFVAPIDVDLWVVVWAGLMLAAAIWFSRRHRRAGLGFLLVVAGLLTWLLVLRQPTSFFLLALPLAWIATIRRDAPESPTPPYMRLVVSSLAVFGALQAYPVAGSQLGLSALGLVPAGALMINDGIDRLRDIRARSTDHIAPAIVAAITAVFLLFGVAGAQEFRSGTPLDLPGSHLLRLSAEQAQNIRSVVVAIDANCSSFITDPGMDSFYVWTGQDPPSSMRYGLWWLSLDDQHQQSIVDQVSDKPGLCVVRNQKVNELWAQGRHIPQRPLVNFIDGSFSVQGTFGDYEVLVRAG